MNLAHPTAGRNAVRPRAVQDPFDAFVPQLFLSGSRQRKCNVGNIGDVTGGMFVIRASIESAAIANFSYASPLLKEEWHSRRLALIAHRSWSL